MSNDQLHNTAGANLSVSDVSLAVAGVALSAGVSAVAGLVSDGSVLTISGASFGAGPVNRMFEDFSNGALGSQVLHTNTNFTHGTENNAKGVRDADSRSGSFANSVWQYSGVEWIPASLKVALGGATEVFTSYATKIPSGSSFTGNDGGSSGTNADYSTDSSWKQDWLLGAGDGATLPANEGDVISLTHVGGGIWHTGGNGAGVLKNWGTNPAWWKWGQWHRVSKWLQAGNIPNVDAGKMYMQIANTIDPITEDTSSPVLFGNSVAPHEFDEYSIPGWARPQSTEKGIKILYDDVYIAWGDNAAARVELGNAETYSACTDLAICDHVSWADNELQVNCREGGLNLASPTWLYVTLADNETRYSYQVVS